MGDPVLVGDACKLGTTNEIIRQKIFPSLAHPLFAPLPPRKAFYDFYDLQQCVHGILSSPNQQSAYEETSLPEVIYCQP